MYNRAKDVPEVLAGGAAEAEHRALVRLLKRLKAVGYRFVTPTAATHRRVVRRDQKREAHSLRDVFGWSLPFVESTVGGEILGLLQAAGAARESDGRWHATLRVSSLGDDLFAHSAFPPSASDAVFFGPDTYRFAEFLRQELPKADPPRLLVDVGAGTGAGAVVAARCCHPRRIVATDVSPAALHLARANFEAAGIAAELRLCAGLDAIVERPDTIIANPPFVAGTSGRTYRDGGDMHGARISLEWALDGARCLAPGGRLLLYTGSAIVNGCDALHAALRRGLDPSGFELSYREIDPDIFGGQLSEPEYVGVERIAAVGAVIRALPTRTSKDA